MSDSQRPVLVLEDLPDVRTWLGTMAAEGLEVSQVQLASDLHAARRWLAILPNNAPAPIALIDLGLPDGAGTDFIRELLARRSDATVIVVTTYDDDEHLVAALAAGAQGYLLKDQDGDQLGERLRALSRGEVAISPPIARRIIEHFRKSAMFQVNSDTQGSLTGRETEVLGLIGRGLTLAEAASVLGLTRHTVADHVKAIYRKLGVNSRAEATREAIRRNLV